MEEVWKDVVGYEGIYKISNHGRLKSFHHNKSGRVMANRQNRRGYLIIDLSKNGVVHTTTLHRLVANAFIPNPENKPEVNHIDTNKANNCVDNLEWVTSKENMEHAALNGLLSYQKEICVSVAQYSLAGDFIKKFDCIADVEKETGISHRKISDCLHGRRKTTHGYIWKRA